MDDGFLGMNFRGLLDSGADYTDFLKPEWNILEKPGFTLLSANRVANEEICKVISTLEKLFLLMNRIKTLRVHVVPELNYTLLWGMDFWLAWSDEMLGHARL